MTVQTSLSQDTALRERARLVIPNGMYGHQNAASLPAGFPQFLRRGSALEDYLDPPALILGVTDDETLARLREMDIALEAPELVVALDEAEAMRGIELCIRRDELPPPGEGEWYYVDLVGLEAQDTEGRRLGEVTSVVPYPTVECLRVEAQDGVREVPIADDWVVEVDVQHGRIVIAGFDALPIERSRR